MKSFRLTAWHGSHAYVTQCFEGEGCDVTLTGNMTKCLGCPHYTAVYDRLAAYEDGGLAPETVQQMILAARQEAAGRLTFSENGQWGIVGMNERNQEAKLYAVCKKLLDYEKTGLSPDIVERLKMLALYKEDDQ